MKWLRMNNMTQTHKPNICTVNWLQTGGTCIIIHVLFKKLVT